MNQRKEIERFAKELSSLNNSNRYKIIRLAYFLKNRQGTC